MWQAKTKQNLRAKWFKKIISVKKEKYFHYIQTQMYIHDGFIKYSTLLKKMHMGFWLNPQNGLTY